MKTYDIRLVVDDGVSSHEAIDLVVKYDDRVFGARLLENNGFGHSLATGPAAFNVSGELEGMIEHRFAHPDPNFRQED